MTPTTTIEPKKCERCDGTGETCAGCDEMCGDAHPAAPMGTCSECGGTGEDLEAIVSLAQRKLLAGEAV